jgi:hypothetical protein
MYIYAVESELMTDPDRYSRIGETTTASVCSYSGCSNHEFPYRFLFGAEGVIMEGTGRTNDGRYIHVNHRSGTWVYRTDDKGNTYKDYFVPNGADFGWGKGKNLTPHVSAAAGPSYSSGTTVYVPELSHAPNGGYFTIADRGGGIVDGDLDVFVGEGRAAYYAAAAQYFKPVGTWESANLAAFIVLPIERRFGTRQ